MGDSSPLQHWFHKTEAAPQILLGGRKILGQNLRGRRSWLELGLWLEFILGPSLRGGRVCPTSVTTSLHGLSILTVPLIIYEDIAGPRHHRQPRGGTAFSRDQLLVTVAIQYASATWHHRMMLSRINTEYKQLSRT